MPIIPLDMLEGETVAAYVARKNAALIENRVRQGWLGTAHPRLLLQLHDWATAPEGAARDRALDRVERYLVANLKDNPV